MLAEQMPLLVEDDLPAPSPELSALLELLPEVTNKDVLVDYLRSKGIPHSAKNWDDLLTRRIQVAVQRGDIPVSELIQLISQFEEYGHSHTFLYVTDADVSGYFIEAEIQQKAANLGLLSRLGAGVAVNKPAEPEVSSIRLEKDVRGTALVFKVVERRTRHRFLKDLERVENNRLICEWDIIESRAVHVVRFWSFGLLEVRIASRDNSTKYEGDVQRILRMASEFFPPVTSFDDYSLSKAKIELWTNRKNYSHLVKFKHSTLRNAMGNTLSASSGGDGVGNLSSDEGVVGGMSSFLQHSDAYCESSSIYWLASEGGLERDLHTILPELRNEFAIPVDCSKSDYEYVFDKLRTLSV